MIKTENKHQEEALVDTAQAISIPTNTQETTQLTKSCSEEEDNKTSNENESILEQSFEVILPSSVGKLNMDSRAEKNELHKGQATQGEDGTSNSRTISENRDNSHQSKSKKSGSFLAKLQSSGDDHDTSSNIPSSIASAFSSFSSFTSNFTLNNSNGNNNNANGLTIETASTSTKFSQSSESRGDIFLKKAAVERKNLVNLTKLIVKDLISSSLKAGRTIDDCQNVIHLSNYFTLIDRVLKHGLKQNLLSNRSAGLWNALDNLPKYLKESTLMSESVRSLANTKTADGKIKAWMRLAMMQKRLPEYFNELLANKDVLLKDIYHDHGFMLNDEAHVFAGLIIGINVIDCNFFVKDANFDYMDDVIDLSPYLRAANSYDDDSVVGGADDNVGVDSASMINMKMVLDQKNYLEEWNKRLESTISNLQSKSKSLEEQNSKLEMEAKVSEIRIQKLQEKRNETPSERLASVSGSIKNLISTNIQQQQHDTDTKLTESTSQTDVNKDITSKHQQPEVDAESDVSSKALEIVGKADDQTTTECSETASSTSAYVKLSSNLDAKSIVSTEHNEELEKQRKWIEQQDKELVSLRERVSILETSYRVSLEKIKVLERDLDVQTSMNVDRETTIKIYEKDIRDKQAQVESLRASLNDAKKLNSDLSERLNETSSKLKDRVKSVSTLQASLDKWKLENKTLASRLQDKQTSLQSMKSELEKAMKNIEELKKYNEKVNDELRKERESGQNSSVTVETQNARICELQEKLVRFEKELMDVKPYKDRSDDLQRRCRDYEQSLEEIGDQLRAARLEVETLKENSAVFLDSQWMDSKQVKACALCEQTFSVTRRKHHCRLCGNVFCQTCSDNKMELASSAKPVRVCDTCHAFLLAKFVKHSSTTSS